MRRIHLSIELVIDERDRVTVDKLSYEVRGKHDAPLAAESITPESVMIDSIETKQEPNLSETSKNEVLALLLSLGFDVSEGQTLMQAKTAARIKEVVRWVKTRNNVASPKRLATKLFEQQ